MYTYMNMHVYTPDRKPITNQNWTCQTYVFIQLTYKAGGKGHSQNMDDPQSTTQLQSLILLWTMNLREAAVWSLTCSQLSISYIYLNMLQGWRRGMSDSWNPS